MEDDDHGRKSRRRSCGGHCEQARRLMRVSTIPPAKNTFDSDDSHERPKRNIPQPQELSTSKKSNKKSDDKEEPCEGDYMLQNLHQLKNFIRRVWNYAWCYTQYCYPGLRTAEYYKKVKHVCKEKEKAKKSEKKNKKKDDKKKDKKKADKKKMENTYADVGPMYLSTGATHSPMFTDSSTQTTDESEWSDVDDNNDISYDGKRPRVKSLKHLAKPLKMLPAVEEELGLGQYIIKRCREMSQAVSDLISEIDQKCQIVVILKVMCILLAPAVMWLGVNYIFLKKKYKSLSGKLRRIKEENELLKKESGKLEMKLSSTEKLKIPFSSNASRRQVVAEFTRLAESRMKSKKEITRLTIEKQALLEELKTARKQRDAARNQYSSLAHGVLETSNLPYAQA